MLEQARRAARQRNKELAELTVKYAKQEAPVKTGAYRDSIRVEADEKNPDNFNAVAGNEEVPYAVFIEFGSHLTPANPVMHVAASRAKKQAERMARRLKVFR